MTTRSNQWYWRPLRIDGHNRIGVYCGRRLALLLGPHEVDGAHALVTMRNLNKPELARCIGYAEITDSKL